MRFDKPKGQRFTKYFRGITNFDGLWWVPFYHKWLSYNEINGHSAQTYCPCNSLRSFRRHLRKHPEIHDKAILTSMYKGYNVYA